MNLRPLGYEFDLCFVWFHVVPSISMTSLILMALGSSCFGLLFLGSGSTFGSTAPPTVLPAVLGPGRRLLASPSRDTEGHLGLWIHYRDSSHRASLRGKHSRDFCSTSVCGRWRRLISAAQQRLAPENACLMPPRPVHSSRPVTIISERRPPGASLHAPICSPNCWSRSNSWQKPFG